MLMVGPRTSEMLAPRLMLDVQLSAMWSRGEKEKKPGVIAEQILVIC
jgi:hypothetical protein